MSSPALAWSDPERLRHIGMQSPSALKQNSWLESNPPPDVKPKATQIDCDCASISITSQAMGRPLDLNTIQSFTN